MQSRPEWLTHRPGRDGAPGPRSARRAGAPPGRPRSGPGSIRATAGTGCGAVLWVDVCGVAWAQFGVGLGGSVGGVFVIAHGYASSRNMHGVPVGEWDFDLAIAAKIGDVLKGIKGIGKVVDTIQKYKKIRYLTETVIKNRGINQPGIYGIPIPLAGIGLHVWIGFKFGEMTIFNSGKGIP